MPTERVLIVGAGIAGSVLAFWLARHDFEIVVLERARAEQKAGQGLEIEQPALAVVQAMGIMADLQAHRTVELGFSLSDEQDRVHAHFGTGGFSPTGALELMRGDLTQVLYHAADRSDKVTYRFQTTLKSLRQTPEKVHVELENRAEKSTCEETFDYVIGADGIKSQTRRLCMGPTEQLGCMKSIGAYVAYFSIPKEPRDYPYSRLCHFPNRKIVWLRPMTKDSDFTSVSLIHINESIPEIRDANVSGDRKRQKEAFADLYKGLGWETPRVIEQMMTADNFYSDDLQQVKLKTWSQDRVVLLGDAAWAPTPFTGQGNQLAIIGAWVLAQEMSRNRSPGAFITYEKRLRGYVEDCQKIPLGGYAPYMLNPETWYGIWLVRKCLGAMSMIARFVTWSKLSTLLPEGKQEAEFDLEMEDVEVKSAS